VRFLLNAAELRNCAIRMRNKGGVEMLRDVPATAAARSRSRWQTARSRGGVVISCRQAVAGVRRVAPGCRAV